MPKISKIDLETLAALPSDGSRGTRAGPPYRPPQESSESRPDPFEHIKLAYLARGDKWKGFDRSIVTISTKK